MGQLKPGPNKRGKPEGAVLCKLNAEKHSISAPSQRVHIDPPVYPYRRMREKYIRDVTKRKNLERLILDLLGRVCRYNFNPYMLNT